MRSVPNETENKWNVLVWKQDLKEKLTILYGETYEV